MGISKRKDPRVTINSRVLVGNSGGLQQALATNISISGLFLQHLPVIPRGKTLDIIVELTKVPNLGEMPSDEVFQLQKMDLPRIALVAQVEIKRSIDRVSSEDLLFQQGVGLQFVRLALPAKQELNIFIEIMIKNIHTLLRLIQQSQQGQKDYIIGLASVLGYPKNLKYSELHAKVLKDYQALNW